MSQLRCPELSFISPLSFLFFSLPLFLSLPSRSYSLSTELGSLSLLQLFSSYNTVPPSPSYYFSISFATISIGFFSFLWWGGRFLFHPFSQPPLEVNESRRLSSFTRHRFHVGRRRAANRVNSSPLVERESVFPFHRGGSNSSGEQATRFIHIHPVAASYSALTQSAILGVRVSSLLPYLFRSLE